MKNLVKEKMLAGKKTLGTFFETGSTTVAECLGLGGLDYLIIDNEHGPYNPQSTLEFVRAAKLYGMTPFARVSEISREAVLRQLDVGVMGLVIPDVRRVDEVERIVEYGKYLPLGKRGVAPTAGALFRGLEPRDDAAAAVRDGGMPEQPGGDPARGGNRRHLCGAL